MNSILQPADTMTSRAYVALVLGPCAAILAAVLTLNLMLAYNNIRHDKNALASAWQQRTRGVTYAPPINDNRLFKALRLSDRVGEIDAIVFGSSTTMGIREAAFAPPLRVYNFAQSGNSLVAVAGEAEYVVARWPGRIRYLVIPLDWALGFTFDPGTPAATDLSPEAVRAVAKAGRRRDEWLAQARDALSLPRVKDLMSIARDVLRAERKAAAFRQYFFEPAGEAYRCADGAPARDYDTLYRGLCNGFRFDGSATFADQRRFDARNARALLAAAAASGSQYATALRRTHGEPHAPTLERLAALAQRFARTGGAAVFFLPPLMPGLEQALLASAHSGAALTRTKAALAAWAARERLTLIDAGASEKFGCSVDEFIDPHHALPACYARVFARLPGAGTKSVHATSD